MDNVPYAFIENVLTVLDEHDVDAIRANLNAPLWTSAALRQLLKRDALIISLAVKQNGTLQIFCRNMKNAISLDELLRMDLRFLRIIAFTVSRYRHHHYDARSFVDMPTERLTDLIKILSHVPVLSCSILAGTSAFAKLLAEELAMNPITTNSLVLELFPEMKGFLKSQLASADLQKLHLIEVNSPEERRAELEAFACSTNFESLTISGEKPQFDFPTLIRLVDAWKRRPGKRAAIAVPTRWNLANEFGALMEKTTDRENCFLERTADYELLVECSDNTVRLSFAPK